MGSVLDDIRYLIDKLSTDELKRLKEIVTDDLERRSDVDEVPVVRRDFSNIVESDSDDPEQLADIRIINVGGLERGIELVFDQD